MKPSLTNNNAQLIAQTILQGFDAQYGRFLEVTAGAQHRFEQAQWQEVQAAMKRRIHLYDHHVDLAATLIQPLLPENTEPTEFFKEVKRHYTQMLPDYPRFEIAESFYNSVYCHLFEHQQMSQELMFVQSSQPRHTQPSPRPLTRDYPIFPGHLEHLLTDLLQATPLRLPWEDLSRDVDDIYCYLIRTFGKALLSSGTIQICNELFFRNKAAWMVGKLQLANGVHPFLLPIHRSMDGKLYVDTCLTRPAEANIAFGFNRAYFMVHAPVPFVLVEWLRDILPGKSTADLYTAIGCQKHGKTEYHREYLAHVSQTDEPFIIAPGIRGMVMLVFTMPTYNRVFKVIKDKFAPQKNIDEAHVRACYQLVKEHDRVGRMPDTQEYIEFMIDKKRISPELMEALTTEAPGKIMDMGEMLCIKHLYIERRITPLNIYLETATPQQQQEAVEEYGSAIKNLASANIFPGDMLLKNFGITENGRVVFYDYDEIRYMTEMRFRDIPPPRYPEDEMASEPWYSVGEDDVFPEEFKSFLYGSPELRQMFDKLHGDLYKASYWRELQDRIKAGEVVDVFAYRKKQRFRQRED
ncbi:MAG: bifunctional isocitrate dehydrogenase kinase/phosphatase [Burkholderiales bacterium]|jgi:isocitrate dehydrogenase kinase/phosphatase|nr:bifunctional isocitrate dehydrogenase kinase/phosphatase [Burkholderiales bacterium]